MWAAWGRIVVLILIVGAALALLPGAHGTLAATCARDEPGQVRIIARTLKPATIRIGPGKSVTWIACGAGNRRLESTSAPRAWATFTLRPNRQRRIVFPRVGRYPYKLDGKTQGVVIVAVVGAAPPPPAPGAANRVVRYDIRVKADYRYRQTLDGGLVETSIAYVGNWRNASVRVYDAFGTLTVTLPNAARGTIDAILRFSDARGETRCQGTLDYPVYPARATLAGGRAKGSKPYFNFDSDVADQGVYQDLTDQRTQACDDLPASDARTVWLEGPFRVAQGVIVHPPAAGVGEMNAGFRRDGGSGVPFPLDRVRDAKAFTIVGPRTIGPQACGTGCSESSTGRVEFVFTPRR